MKILTEPEIKKLAIDCQDASNIIAVSMILAQATKSLSRLGFDSPGVRSHPAIILIIDKLGSMVADNCQDFTAYCEAYDVCLSTSLEVS